MMTARMLRDAVGGALMLAVGLSAPSVSAALASPAATRDAVVEGPAVDDLAAAEANGPGAGIAVDGARDAPPALISLWLLGVRPATDPVAEVGGFGGVDHSYDLEFNLLGQGVEQTPASALKKRNQVDLQLVQDTRTQAFLSCDCPMHQDIAVAGHGLGLCHT